MYYFGSQDNYNVMVMDLLGLSLEDLFNKCQRRFSLKTGESCNRLATQLFLNFRITLVLQIADQMLERVDTLHSRHLIHRDIKPVCCAHSSIIDMLLILNDGVVGKLCYRCWRAVFQHFLRRLWSFKAISSSKESAAYSSSRRAKLDWNSSLCKHQQSLGHRAKSQR